MQVDWVPKSTTEFLSWITGVGAMSLPAWIGYIKDVSAIAAVLAPIAGLALTLLMIHDTSVRITKRSSIDDESDG